MENKSREWIGRNCKFAAAGIADQIAQGILATNKAPTPQQVMEAVAMFVQDHPELTGATNVKSLASQIMNVIDGRGGNAAPVQRPVPQPQRPIQQPRQNPFAF